MNDTYETRSYEVYIKVDDQNNIIAINSSAFIVNLTGWIRVDEGKGDKYHHAQGNYLNKPIYDENGLCNYKYIGGEIVERTAEDKAPELAKQNAVGEIAELKRKLAETDYVSAKIAEGAATKEEYKDVLGQRAEWRAKINELEDFINNV
ncbi:MAG: hypothetical protein NC452_15190 [Eubacterium sp.]|nr:hypothetical protein [Eubacterium sp.]